jgi:1,4-dihydroxy-2-naphthoate octaprenyltransferase
MPLWRRESQIFSNFLDCPSYTASTDPKVDFMIASTLSPWFLAVRPKTLTTALIPIWVGTALSYAVHQDAQPSLGVFALLSSIFIQIGTNFINDAMDFKKGADTAERLGPQRVTQSGLLSPQVVWWGGLFCFAIAALLGLPLVLAGGWPIVVIGILSLLAGYAYTGGPFPLAYLGLGDLFVMIFFGWLAVGGMYFLNTGHFDWNAILAGTQVGSLATVIIAINNFRDSRTDLKANKKTLPVRFGPTFARFEIAILSFIPFLIGFYWFMQGWVWAFCLPLLVIPIAFRLVSKVQVTPPGQVYNQFLAQGALLHLSFGALLGVGLFLR